MTDQAPNLVVAFGGVSPEHEVSVLTAIQVMSALSDSMYQIQPLYINKSGQWFTGDYLKELENYRDLSVLQSQVESCYFNRDELGRSVLEVPKKGLFGKLTQHPIHTVIVAFHGGSGENGAFQGVCEQYNIPYTGSGVLASSLGMDKVKAKQLCEANQIPVTASLNFYEDDWEQHHQTIMEEVEQLGYPVIVKPSSLGSSIGVKKVEHSSALLKSIAPSWEPLNPVLLVYVSNPLVAKMPSHLPININVGALEKKEWPLPTE